MKEERYDIKEPTNNPMSFWIVLYCLIVISTPRVTAGTIECQKSANVGNCVSVDSNILLYKTGTDTTTIDPSLGGNSIVNQTTLWVSNVFDNIFRLIIPNDSIPHNSISYIKNTNPTLDIDVNVSSSRFPYDSPNTTIITSLIKNLRLVSDGKSGTSGLNSSQLCANAFSSGALGVDAKNYWSSGRAGGASDSCNIEDVKFADNMFSCPSNYTLNTKGPTDTIEYSKVILKRRCSAQIDQPICIGRTVDLTCTTNLNSNICCDNTNKKWEDLGSYYNQAPQGSTCDPTKCVINFADDPGNLSGDVTTFKSRVFEKRILNSVGGIRGICLDDVKSHKPMEISWNVPYFDSELGIDAFHPGNSMSSPTDADLFAIPLIDNIITHNGDDLTPSGLRYYVTGIKDGLNADPRNIIKNCIGLNGSNPGKLSCERVSGPSFWIGLGLIDKYGNKSNTLKFQIPEGLNRETRTLYATNGYGNFNYMNYGTSHPPIYVSGPVAGNISCAHTTVDPRSCNFKSDGYPHGFAAMRLLKNYLGPGAYGPEKYKVCALPANSFDAMKCCSKTAGYLDKLRSESDGGDLSDCNENPAPYLSSSYKAMSDGSWWPWSRIEMVGYGASGPSSFYVGGYSLPLGKEYY